MKQRILWPAGCSIALLACGGGDGGGMPPPNPDPSDCSTGISTPRAFPSLSFASPVAMKQAPNDGSRWFVVEQGGRIRTFENDAAATTAEDFVDLSARVHMDGEAGLLGMAFHPDFATNGRVYLNFSELVGGQIRSVTAEFTSMDGGQTLEPASERDLLTVVKPAANHNGGNLAFGPDGFLYLGLGDGGGAGDPNGNAQNRRALLGKMLRIDVDSRPGGAPYGIPGGANGNPFFREPALQRRRHRRPELPRGLRARLSQSLALELRQPVGRPVGRRCRPGQLRGDRPRRAQRQLRLGFARGRALLRARDRLRNRGAHGSGRGVRPRRSASRSSVATYTAARKRHGSRDAMCSATWAA